MALSEKYVADYLSRRLGAQVSLVDQKESFPGFSRETWLLRAEVSGVLQGFVLRADTPEGGGAPGSDVQTDLR